MNGRPPIRIVNPAEDSEHPLSWWLKCRLETTLSEPREHVLVTPEGERVVITTAEMLSASKLRSRMLDATGRMPPLPDKAKERTPFLEEVWGHLFAHRQTFEAPVEASARGTLEADCLRALRSAPETDKFQDIERGAIGMRDDGSGVFSARVLLERIRRICPVAFTPAEFYKALSSLGCSHGVMRFQGWRGRAWVAPASLLRVGDPDLDPSAELSDAAEPPLLPSGE